MKELINSCVVYFIMVISGKRRAKHTDEPNCKQTGFLVIRWSLYFFFKFNLKSTAINKD